MIEQRRVHFSGHVQGVGFRYTTHRIAAGYQVTGYVRNLQDGRVELVIEGKTDEIDALLDELRDRFADHIRSETNDQRPPTGVHQGFEIRR